MPNALIASKSNCLFCLFSQHHRKNAMTVGTLRTIPKRRSLMSNQPQQSSSQPTPAIVFLLHALWSFVCGLLLSLVSVLYQYATSPNGTFSLQGAVQLGIGAVLGYFVTYFMTHKADQAQWLQGRSEERRV